MNQPLDYIDPWWKRIGCMTEQKAMTGEEAAMCDEIRDLREAITPDPDAINHLELLKKYMRHVAEEEGIDFTRRLNSDDNETRFTDDEVEELERISQEYQLEAKYG